MTAGETKDHARAIAAATAAGDVVGLAAIANELLALAAAARAQLAAAEQATQGRRAGDARRKQAQRARGRTPKDQLGFDLGTLGDTVEQAEQAPAPAVPSAINTGEADPQPTRTDTPATGTASDAAPADVTGCHVTSRDTSPSSPSSSFPPTPPLTTPPASPPPAHTHRGRARAAATAERLSDPDHRAALLAVLALCDTDAQCRSICVVLEELATGTHGVAVGWPVVGRALVDFAGRGATWNPKLFRAIAADLAPPAPKAAARQPLGLTRYMPTTPSDDRLCRECDAKPGRTRSGRAAIWHERTCRHFDRTVDIDLTPAPSGSVLDMARKIGLGPRSSPPADDGAPSAHCSATVAAMSPAAAVA